MSILFKNCQPNVKINKIVIPSWGHKTSIQKTGQPAIAAGRPGQSDPVLLHILIHDSNSQRVNNMFTI